MAVEETTWTTRGVPFLCTERLPARPVHGHVVAPLLVSPATRPPHRDFAATIVRALLVYGGVVVDRDAVELMTAASPSGVVDWPVRTVRALGTAELRWDDFGATLRQGPRRARIVGTRWEGGAAIAVGETGSLRLLLADDLSPVTAGSMGAILPLTTAEHWRRRGRDELAVARALANDTR